MASTAKRGEEEEDDALMGDDDIRAWNPSEFDDGGDDGYDDAKGSGDGTSGRDNRGDDDRSDRSGDEERDSREDFYESHEDEQSVLGASELDSEPAEDEIDDASRQQQRGEAVEDDEHIGSDMESAASDSNEPSDPHDDELEAPESEDEAGREADSEEGDQSTSSWLNVELSEFASFPAESHSTMDSTPASSAPSSDSAQLSGAAVVAEARDSGVSVAGPSPLKGVALDDISGGARDASRPWTLDASQPAPSPTPAPIHPLPMARTGSFPMPLSPSSSPHKRSNSLYVTPTMASTALMKRTEASVPPASAARTSQLWDRDLDPSKRSSRLLDEWKRKEIWLDFKRAEENVACPATRKADPSTPVETQTTQAMRVAVERGGGSCLESPPSSRPALEDPPSRIKRSDRESSRETLTLGNRKMRRESSWSDGLSPTAVPRLKTLERRQTISTGSPVGSPTRLLANSLAAICSSSSSSSGDRTTDAVATSVPVHPVIAAVSPAVSSTPAVSMAEHEQLVKDKEALQAETERYRRSELQDKETIQSLSERLKQLEALERENKFLKDETQKLLMQVLNAKEEVKTLNDQLALRGKSEEQLKLQTKQLLEQNQSLQVDLLEKIAAETDKIQKMARLSADKQALIHEIEEKEAVASDRRDTERRKARKRLLLRLVKRKHRSLLLSSVLRWKINAREVSCACSKIANVVVNLVQRSEAQRKARAFRQLMANSMKAGHQSAVTQFSSRVESVTNDARARQTTCAVLLLTSALEQARQRRLASALRAFQSHTIASRSHAQRRKFAASTLRFLLWTSAQTSLQHAWTKWRVSAHSESATSRHERVQDAEDRLAEAKECVFSLSRAKTKLADKLEAVRDDNQHLANQLAETAAELRLAKHGYVATVMRLSERAWLREFFADWRVYTGVSLSSKQLRLQVQMAELRAVEREKHAQSLDEYTRVLKNDLERFQFFSQDKRVAVDVLTKKLSRVEGRYREMEERHAVLEERAHSLKNQLAAFVDWEGAMLPFAVLVLCKDLAVGNLRELFMVHASIPSVDISSATVSSVGLGSIGSPSALTVLPAQSSVMSFGGASESTTGVCSDSQATATTPRLSVDSLVRLVASSSVAAENLVACEDLTERLLRHLPSYAADRGLLFHDFLSGLDGFLNDVVVAGDRRYEQVKQFWASLLGLMTSLRRAGASSGSGSCGPGGSAGSRGLNDSNMLFTPRSSSTWAGRLSDEILQNQEKLLAVLEHETAVVERAVMEKASLKHTYPPPADEEGGRTTRAGSTFFEYQCDPVLPPDHSSVVSSPTSPGTSLDPAASVLTAAVGSLAPGSAASILEKYANWHTGAQIRDLFLACHRPLLKILVQYSDARRDPRHGDQYCLELAAVTRMLQDMRLCPSFLSRETIEQLYTSFRSPTDVLLPPQGFALFLGACALELYANSLSVGATRNPVAASQASAPPPPPVPYLLSAREVLLSFFGDLGLLGESDVPPPSRLAFVGMDVEAILWPLFEYYATGGGQIERPDDERIGMTSVTFTAFMGEIAGMGDKAPTIFRRAMLEVTRTQPRRKRISFGKGVQQGGGGAASPSSGDAIEADVDALTMYLDDFYIAIGFIQAERVGPGASFASAGDAVRQWMQQTH